MPASFDCSPPAFFSPLQDSLDGPSPSLFGFAAVAATVVFAEVVVAAFAAVAVF